MKSFEIHICARRELVQAADYLSQQREGLGNEFLDAFVNAIREIEAHPAIGSPVEGLDGVRVWLIAEFSYQIVYVASKGTEAVYAVTHTSREPSYWTGRMKH